jgi:energy-coupling factor transport system permease protein
LPAAGLTSPRTVWLRTWPMLFGAASVGLVNVLLSEDADLVTGLGLALRVVGLALPGVLLVAATDPVRLADALTIHWRMSPRFAYGALAALRLVPLLVTEFESVRLAQRTRGVEAGRNPVARVRMLAGIGFILLVSAVRRGSRLATAMDARGFDAGVPRTNARGSTLHLRDAAFVVGAVVACAAAVTLSVTAGAWDPVVVG